MSDMIVRDQIGQVLDGVRDILYEKNSRYGNSALQPLRVFSKAGAEEQILVRLDDKLSRVAQGELRRNDVVDLIGYLVLLMVARHWDAAGLID